MHLRFEARRLAEFLLGARPPVKILQIAWLEKQRHILTYLNDYYRRHKALPLGRHNLGKTADLGLIVGVIDFGRARQQMRQLMRCQRRRQARLRRLRAIVKLILHPVAPDRERTDD